MIKTAVSLYLNIFGESKIDGITKQDIYKFLDWRKNTINERLRKDGIGPNNKSGEIFFK